MIHEIKPRMYFGKRFYISITSSEECLSKTLCKCTITQPNKIKSTLIVYISSQAVTRILQNYRVHLYPGFVKVSEVGLEFGIQFNPCKECCHPQNRIPSCESKATSHITLDLLKDYWKTYCQTICMLFVSLGMKNVKVFLLCHCYVIYVTKIGYVVL